MRDQSLKHDARFVAVVFPLFDFPIDARYPFADIHHLLQEKLRSLDVPALDLTAIYKGIEPRRLQLVPGHDSHPNEIAHRMAAEEIYSWFRREKLVPDDLFVERSYRHRDGIAEKGRDALRDNELKWNRRSGSKIATERAE
jgi:hypothetical protein